MIGRPYRPTDVDNEFGLTPWLGYIVKVIRNDTTEVEGYLANITVEGEVAIEGYDGLCAAIIPVSEIDVVTLA